MTRAPLSHFRQRHRHTLLALLLLASGLVDACGGGGSSSATEPPGTVGTGIQASATPLQDRYAHAGPRAVSVDRRAGCCDGKGNAYDVYRPRDLGAAASPRLPVVVWGSGSDATPERYDTFLMHLASWGMVVVATRDTATGTGDTLLDALAFIDAESNRSSSPYFGRIDLGQVASAGHSQGAAGAVNALTASQGRIRHALAVGLPSQAICHGPYCNRVPIDMPPGSAIFFVSGELDTLSPPTQAGSGTVTAPYQSVQAYYDAVPTGVVKAKGSVRGADHNDLQGQPGCVAGAPACRTGVQGYLGYPTAWLLWRLNGTADGPAMFSAANGEMTTKASGSWVLPQTNVP